LSAQIHQVIAWHVQQHSLNLALGHLVSIPARTPTVLLLKTNQKYGQRALRKVHSTSYCAPQSKHLLGWELLQGQDSLHMQAYPTQLRDSLGSPGFLLQEQEQE
jgi:hypothetical protein